MMTLIGSHFILFLLLEEATDRYDALSALIKVGILWPFLMDPLLKGNDSATYVWLLAMMREEYSSMNSVRSMRVRFFSPERKGCACE